MTRLLARLRCALSASHDTRTTGNVTTCARGCGFRWERDALADLSPRQREVLRRMAQGRSVSEIAGDLGLSPDTVKDHISALYSSLDVHGHEEAYTAVGWLVVPEEAA